MGIRPVEIRALSDAVLDLLFPPRCPFCGRLSKGVCPECGAALPWTGEEDGVREIGAINRGIPEDGEPALCVMKTGVPEGGGRKSADRRAANMRTSSVQGVSLLCAGALRYEGLAREGLLRMKFRDRPAAAETMGQLAAQCAAERFGGQFDTVTWVPVSVPRRRKRGYDQAELLARAACRLWDTAPVRLLDKVRDNPAQSGIADAEERSQNVSGAYRLHGSAAGRKVLLIDDICTTGATLRECAAVLYEGGAAAVLCAAVALAGHSDTEGAKG